MISSQYPVYADSSDMIYGIKLYNHQSELLKLNKNKNQFKK